MVSQSRHLRVAVLLALAVTVADAKLVVVNPSEQAEVVSEEQLAAQPWSVDATDFSGYTTSVDKRVLPAAEVLPSSNSTELVEQLVIVLRPESNQSLELSSLQLAFDALSESGAFRSYVLEAVDASGIVCRKTLHPFAHDAAKTDVRQIDLASMEMPREWRGVVELRLTALPTNPDAATSTTDQKFDEAFPFASLVVDGRVVDSVRRLPEPGPLMAWTFLIGAALLWAAYAERLQERSPALALSSESAAVSSRHWTREQRAAIHAIFDRRR